MSKSARVRRTRKHRRSNRMKAKFGGGKRAHTRPHGRTGAIRSKRLKQNSVRS